MVRWSFLFMLKQFDGLSVNVQQVSQATNNAIVLSVHVQTVTQAADNAMVLSVHAQTLPQATNGTTSCLLIF